MKILGISAFYHDAAAALIVDGEVIAAAQEERFTRVKHDPNFPSNAIRFCLEASNWSIESVDHFVFYDSPNRKIGRVLTTQFAMAPYGMSQYLESIWSVLSDRLFSKRKIIDGLRTISSDPCFKPKILFCDHHVSHAASAFFPSPFDSAAVLVMDGVGEWATTSISEGVGNELTQLESIEFPHSLGLLYSAYTSFLGFKVNSGEYKVMGLAPYGRPIYKDLIFRKMVQTKGDGSFQLNMEFFDFCVGRRMYSDRFSGLFGVLPREPEGEIKEIHLNIAASIQAVTEDLIVGLAQRAKDVTGSRALCLAGGVALNCVANGILSRKKIFDDIWVQPAAGDAGGALGAALAFYYATTGSIRKPNSQDGMKGALLGPSFCDAAIEASLNSLGAKYTRVDRNEFFKTVAKFIANGSAVGWFQDRMEFGPRALGARSILADPRGPMVQKNLNLKIKFRESFRPFAPAVLEEHCSDCFELEHHSPYMLFVTKVSEAWLANGPKTSEPKLGLGKINEVKSLLPAITHVDYSARVQTVSQLRHPTFHQLIEAFFELTGCPVLVNTSFNVRGEPIVNSVEDAFRCFMGTGLDYLAIGSFILDKSNQETNLIERYENKFELD